MADIAALNIKVETTQVKSASKDLDNLASTGSKTEASTKKLSTATDQLQGSMSQLRGVVGGLAVAFGAYKIASYIKDSALLAARYETLGVTMTRAGANAGYTKGEMDSLEQSLRSQGIAAVEARQTLTKLAASNMDLSKASQLARAAQDLAVVANINSSEAFERLVQGIQTGQTETLRTLGINVNFEKSYKDLAKQLKINVDQLTETEKQQARMNAALEKAVGYTGLYEGAMDTAGKQINSMKRYVDDLAVSFGTAFNESTASIVKDMTNSIKDMNTAVKDPAFQLGLAGVGQFGASVFGAITLGGTAALDVLGNTAARLTGIMIMVDAFINRHQKDMDAGYNILTSADPAAELRRAGTRRTDEALTAGRTRTGQVLAPGALEAEFNIQQSGRDKGAVVEREQTASQIAAAKKAARAIETANRARLDAIDDINKLNDETIRSTQYINDEIAALDAVSGMYDEAYSDKLTMLNAATKAQKEYDDALRTGVTMENAAAKQAATLAKAQRDIDERKSQGAKGVAGGFAGGAYDAQVQQIKDQYALASKYTTDRVALERAMNSKLTQLEIARLRATGDAWDGMKAAAMDYAESATNAGENMAKVFTNAMSGMEDALTDFVTSGKMSFSSLAESIMKDLVRMQIRAGLGSIVQSASSGGLWSSITGLFGFNHGGGMVGSPTFSRQVPLAAFAGAERFHDGGWPGLKSDEVPIIAQKGERVLSRAEVAAGSNGGTQTVTVVMKDAKGNQTAAPMSFNTNGMREFILNVVRDGSERGLLGAS